MQNEKIMADIFNISFIFFAYLKIYKHLFINYLAFQNVYIFIIREKRGCFIR